MGIHEDFASERWSGRRGGPFEGKYLDWPEKIQEVRDEVNGFRPLAPLDAPLVQVDGVWLTYREYLELNIKAMEQAIEENPWLKGAAPRIEVEYSRVRRPNASTLAAVALIEAGKTLDEASAEVGAKRETVFAYLKRLGFTYKKRFSHMVANRRRQKAVPPDKIKERLQERIEWWKKRGR